jgi:predicted MFS family arabinose efflux permease
MAPSRALGPLTEDSFRILFLARSISLFGSGMAPIALAFAVLDDLDASAADLGLVLAAATLPQVIFLLVGGVWADRLPRHRLLIATDLLMFATQGVLAVLLLAGAAQLWQLIVLQAVRGLAQAFFFPASTGLVPETVSAARLQQANALLGMTATGGHMFGAAAGGVFVAAFGPAYALAFDAATFLISAALLSRLTLVRQEASPPGTRNFVQELTHGWQEVASRRWVWVPVLAATVSNGVYVGSFLVIGALVADRELGGAAAWGLINAALGAGALVGGLVAIRVRPKRPLLVGCAATVLVVPVLPMFALGVPAPAVAAAVFLGSLGIELYGTLWDTALQEHIPRDRLSRVSAYDYVGSAVAVPIGLTLAGPLAEQVGIDEMLWAGAVILMGTTAVQLLVTDVRELTRSTPRAAATVR